MPKKVNHNAETVFRFENDTQWDEVLEVLDEFDKNIILTEIYPLDALPSASENLCSLKNDHFSIND